MKKNVGILIIAVVLTLAVAWAAFGQAGGGGGQRGFGQMREAQQKALAGLQESIAKLKSMTEAQAKAMEGRSFQDMTEEDRTKMRQQGEERQKIMASMQQQMDALKGGRQLATEHQQMMTPLKEALASAQKENAKGTAAMLEKLIADRQKQFNDKMATMGYTPEQLERMMQPRQRQQ